MVSFKNLKVFCVPCMRWQGRWQDWSLTFLNLLLCMILLLVVYTSCILATYCIHTNFWMTKFTKIICWPILQKIFSKICGNHFKRYITCANYDFFYFQKCSVFKIFVNKVVRKLLCIWYYIFVYYVAMYILIVCL